jgi:hypothetical protein
LEAKNKKFGSAPMPVTKTPLTATWNSFRSADVAFSLRVTRRVTAAIEASTHADLEPI